MVPTSERIPLIARTHDDLQHAGARRTLRAFQNTFTWEGMSADVKRYVLARLICILSRAHKNLAHGQYRALVASGPGEKIGIDFYSMMTSCNGMSIIMATIDLFSRWWRLFALPNRQAAVVTRCLLDEWIHVRGVPQVIYSDSDHVQGIAGGSEREAFFLGQTGFII